MKEDTTTTAQLSTLRTPEVAILPALGQQLLKEAVMEVVEGEMVGQLRSGEELVSTEATFLLRHLNDAAPALTGGVGQSQRVAVLWREMFP